MITNIRLDLTDEERRTITGNSRLATRKEIAGFVKGITSGALDAIKEEAGAASEQQQPSPSQPTSRPSIDVSMLPAKYAERYEALPEHDKPGYLRGFFMEGTKR